MQQCTTCQLVAGHHRTRHLWRPLLEAKLLDLQKSATCTGKRSGLVRRRLEIQTPLDKCTGCMWNLCNRELQTCTCKSSNLSLPTKSTQFSLDGLLPFCEQTADLMCDNFRWGPSQVCIRQLCITKAALYHKGRVANAGQVLPGGTVGCCSDRAQNGARLHSVAALHLPLGCVALSFLLLELCRS